MIAVGAATLLYERSREPVYQGKTLTTWLDEYCSNHWSSYPDRDREAQAAIRQIGTNEIPHYLEMLSRHASPIKMKLLACIPPAWNRRFHIPTTNEYQNKLEPVRKHGAYGLIALGTDAKPAIPALLARLNDPKEEPRVRYFAIWTIYCLGPPARDALPSVIKCLNDREGSVRSDAILALGSIHEDAGRVVPLLVDIIEKNFTNRYNVGEVWFAVDSLAKFKGEAASTVPVIVKCLSHSELAIRGAAILALGDIRAQPELAVPALIEHLKTTETKTLGDKRMIYTYTFSALSSFGSEARAAVPVLLQSINDDDEDIRMNARAVLKSIEPDAAAKAEYK